MLFKQGNSHNNNTDLIFQSTVLFVCFFGGGLFVFCFICFVVGLFFWGVWVVFFCFVCVCGFFLFVCLFVCFFWGEGVSSFTSLPLHTARV